ncbi:translation initiation factor IF-3 [Promicromonospora sp. NPDC050249]|uniref:translation initiation factor IF-3 n=1 Tax=Promicromonospora sp. NPDC050249 TaxID=3154743 RepID=UPI0033D83D51
MASTCVQGGSHFSFLVVNQRLLRSITITEPRINDRIRVPEVRLIGPGGEQVGVVATAVALKLAQDADLDLVEVAPDARPPVTKLMDFGKFKYESDMKAREARRNQANTVLKEIRFRLKIDPHDYETKKGHVVRFLSAGDKVKVMIMFRGREQSRPEMGRRLLERLAEDVAELGFVESMPKQDGRNMTMVLGPVKKKADAKVEQRKRSTEINAGRMTKSEAKAQARAADEPETSEPVEDQVDETSETTVEEPAAVAAPEPVVEEPVAEPEPVAAVEPEPEPVVEAEPEPVAAAEPEPVVEAPAPVEPKPATKPAAKTASKPAAKPAAKAAPKPVPAPKPAPKPVAPKPRAPKAG